VQCYHGTIDCTRHDVITWPAWVKPPAERPWSVTDDDRWQITTDAHDSY